MTAAKKKNSRRKQARFRSSRRKRIRNTVLLLLLLVVLGGTGIGAIYVLRNGIVFDKLEEAYVASREFSGGITDLDSLRADGFAKNLCVVVSDVPMDGVSLGENQKGLLLDLDDRKVLYSKQALQKVYPASITKIMTAMLALKYGNTFLNTVSNTSTGYIQFTLKYFRDLPRSQMSSFCHSLVCALAAGLLSSFVGILLAYYTRRRKIKGMAAAEFGFPALYHTGNLFRPWLCGSIQPSAVSAAGNPVDHSVKLRVSSDFCGMQGG